MAPDRRIFTSRIFTSRPLRFSISFLAFQLIRAEPVAFRKQCPWDPTAILRYGTSPVPVDDATDDPGAFTPWTDSPICATLGSANGDEKFCVYSASAYNENSGISLITTPDLAASLVNAVNNSTAAYLSRRHLAGQTEVEFNEFDQEIEIPYEVVDIPGMGKGVIATQKIKQFDVIMTGFPAMIVDNAFFPPDVDMAPAEGPRLYNRALEGLADPERFLDLARRYGGDMHVVEDVIRTNAFGLRINDRGTKGLYPEIARMNHGCDPNAFGRFTRHDLALAVIATRDIEPGEEILISYIPLGMPYKYRQSGLSNWGFNCTCSLCSASERERNESDRRREKLVKIYDQMNFEGTDYAGLVELTKEFVDIVTQERLVVKVGEYYKIFMRLYFDYGDTESALKYAKTALKYAETFSDPGGNFCATLREDVDAIAKQLALETGGEVDENRGYFRG